MENEVKILDFEDICKLFANDFNEIIMESVDSFTLDVLNKEIAECKFTKKEIKEIVNLLDLDPDTKNAVMREQLRLYKFQEKAKKSPFLYSRSEWNRNGKRRHSNAERLEECSEKKSQTKKRTLNDLKINITPQTRSSGHLSKNDIVQQMEL